MQITTLIENEKPERTQTLLAEFGLSLHIQHRGKSILFDTGATGAAVKNAVGLNVDLSKVDAVVLSHHHFDHGGGLPEFFAVNSHAKVYLRPPPEGKEYFRALWVVSRYIGLEEGLLERYKDRFTFVDAFTEFLPGAFIFTNIMRQYDLPQGDRYLYLKTSDGYIRDSFNHELVLALREEDGFVVFTGCGHSGVLNMVQTVINHFPSGRIKGVIGGFHLVGMPSLRSMAGTREEMLKLGRAMLEFPVEKYWTGHCTGHKAYAVLKGVLADRLAEIHTGTVLAL